MPAALVIENTDLTTPQVTSAIAQLPSGALATSQMQATMVWGAGHSPYSADAGDQGLRGDPGPGPRRRDPLLRAPARRSPDDAPQRRGAAWHLTGGGWLYVLRDADRAGSAVVTLLVDDLDERLAAAAERGIELGPVETKAVTVRVTWITDPDRNRVQIGQPG